MTGIAEIGKIIAVAIGFATCRFIPPFERTVNVRITT